MHKLPHPVLNYLLTFLDVNSVAIFSRTCRNYRRYNTSSIILMEKLEKITALKKRPKNKCAFCYKKLEESEEHTVNGFYSCGDCYGYEFQPKCAVCGHPADRDCCNCGKVVCYDHNGICCTPINLCCESARNSEIKCKKCELTICINHVEEYLKTIKCSGCISAG
jgi:hypothetical protein